MDPDPPALTPAVLRRIAGLAATFDLGSGAEVRLGALLELLAEDAHAPTAVREPADAVDAHLADSLVCLDLDLVRAARQIADLGAGAGFPGLPLAIALPGASVALVESSSRKCSFLARALERTHTDNAEIVHSRTEDWTDGLLTNDLITARALAPLSVLCEYAAPLLSIGGHLVAWKGRRDEWRSRRAPSLPSSSGSSRPACARSCRSRVHTDDTCTST